MTKKQFNSEDWHSVHIPVWKEHLHPLLRGGGVVNALEIGSYEGRSSCWILDNMMNNVYSTLTCVDTWDGRHDIEGLETVQAEALFDNNVSDHRVKVNKLKMTSYLAMAQLLQEEAEFDFIYVDGCHEGITVLHDLLVGWELLRDGGFMVADDMRWHGKDINVSPRSAWSSFIAMNPPGLELVHFHRQAIMRKVLH